MGDEKWTSIELVLKEKVTTTKEKNTRKFIIKHSDRKS
jgi:hypothetical protein